MGYFRVKKVFLAVFFLFVVFSLLTAQVTVVKRAQDVNPNLYFSKVIGDAELSGYIRSNLLNCGWFNVVSSSNNAKYKVLGKVVNGKVSLSVTGDNSFTLGLKNDKNNLQRTAKLLVDAILKRIFNIPGICASKIAFVAQTGKIKEIYECSFDGKNIKKITANKSLSLEPNWGGNNFLVYTYFRNNYTDVVGLKLSDRKT